MLKYQTLMQHNHISSHSRALLRDMECFPVRKDRRGKVSWDFEDGYGAPRTFGGKRSHEGVDIMASKDQPGCLQIQSVCDGVIEQIGWLKLGGYRIGIRSKQGYYVYYAHLQQYAPDLRKGSKVKAGDYLGLMGKYRVWTGRDQWSIRGTSALWNLYCKGWQRAKYGSISYTMVFGTVNIYNAVIRDCSVAGKKNPACNT